MKVIHLFLAFCAVLSASGQTVAYTTPSGYVKNDLVVGFNPIGINLHGEVLVSGTVDSVNGAGDTFTDADADFSTVLSTANLATNTYLLEITSADTADGSALNQNGAVAVVTGATATTVTIEGGGVDSGEATYTIRQARNLNEIFGTGANAQLAGGTTTAGADIVWLPDGSGSYNQYFYSTFGGANEFRSTATAFASPPQPISVFYPDGLFVQIASTAKTVTIFGEIKTTPTIAAASPGFNLVALQNPTGQTLAETGIENFITTGTTPSAADIIWVPTGPGTFNEYFFSTFSGANVWRLKGSPFFGDEGTVTLPSSFFIQRNSATGTAGAIT
ncbi:hypothetical protein N9192_02195, partial [Akkermansiaceae bacterium]|nr:hypothetical protein [Akkermansiaceae bacterium]